MLTHLDTVFRVPSFKLLKGNFASRLWQCWQRIEDEAQVLRRKRSEFQGAHKLPWRV